ncbi:MAG: DMT family transporter [Chloroflexia bacterium]
MGAAAALAAAVFAAGTNLILRHQVAQIGGATAQTWRATVSTLLFAVIFLALRNPLDLFELPAAAVAVLLASVLLNMVLGDLLQYAAITRLGIALAMPITCSYPLVTLLIAVVALGERPSVRAAVGTVLIVGGVILVALPRRALAEEGVAHRAAPAAGHWAGVAFALAAAICMAAATVLTRVALRDIDVISANMLRLPFAAVLCGAIGTTQRRQAPWRVERRSLVPLCLAGVTGLGSSSSFLIAIRLVGASTTATLNAAAPIFGLLGAVIFLHERPTTRNVVGTLVAFAGVALVV